MFKRWRDKKKDNEQVVVFDQAFDSELVGEVTTRTPISAYMKLLSFFTFHSKRVQRIQNRLSLRTKPP